VDCEWTKLPILPSVTLGVQTLHQDGKERKFVRVRRQFSGRRMAQVGKDGIALFTPVLDRAVESARAQSPLSPCLCHTFSPQR
jgi:hypothetical protein